MGRDGGKKLLILVATDGQPTDDRGIVDKGTLYNILLQERGPQGAILVTFVACTDDEGEIGYLNEWDQRIPNIDVVDDYYSERTEVLRVQGSDFPFSRGDWVCKLLLGGIDPEIDGLDERRVGGFPGNLNNKTSATMPNYGSGGGQPQLSYTNTYNSYGSSGGPLNNQRKKDDCKQQ
jgi:hypothetical protein